MNTNKGGISRRTLLAGAPVAAAQVRLAQRVRVAILGLEGHPGEIVNPLPRLPEVDITGIWDGDPKEVARFGETNPRLAAAKRYEDYRRMLDAEKPDVVAVCNTNGERAAAILECAARKINVIAEKPLAITRPDLERVKDAVARSGIRLGMLLPMRYSPSYQALRRICESGEIGEIAQISAQKSYKAGERPEWMRRRASYGSTILWIGIHMIDLMRFTSGRDFTHASSFQSRVDYPEIGDMENTTVTSFRMDNNGTATLHMDYFRPESAPTHGDDRLRLAGTKGVAEYMEATGVTVMSRTGPPRVVRELPAARSVFAEYVAHVYGGAPASLSLADIYRNCEITIGADEAAAQGRIVRL